MLRAAGATELVGIEMDRDAARRAREVFDVVHEGDAQRVVTGLSADEPFDVTCCYDILEHLYDPETVLRQLLAIRRSRRSSAHLYPQRTPLLADP